MLTINNLTYRIGGRTIIDEASVAINDGWKVGVVGPNGAGKSTLFKLIAGDLHADGGTITLSDRRTFGMVRQDIADTDKPIIDMVVDAHEEMAALRIAAETETDPYKIGDIYARLGELDFYSAPAKAAVLLNGLGFTEEQLQQPFSSLSGGWRMRVALAAALFVEPDVLLLDEPTNHLDLEAIMWLEGYLANYPHTLLIISHDREILNTCVDHVLHVDKTKLTLYTGNYDTFEKERAEKLGLQQKMHEKQLAAKAHMQAFVDRFRASAAKARQAQSRIKAIEKMDIVDAVIAERALKFAFPDPDELPAPLLALRATDIGYSAGKPILKRVNQNIDLDDRIALMGANGNGKSTLMKLIAGKLTPLAGEYVRSGKLRIGYFAQHQTEELDVTSTPYMEMYRLMMARNPATKESQVRARLGQFHFSKDLADNTIGSLSGGEKARLLFALMSFDTPHLLLLDEPTNHLDIDAREALVQALNTYKGAVVMVSHDPHMVERVADRLWLVEGGACEPFDGDLQDYRKHVIQQRRNARSKARAESKGEKPAEAAPAPAAKINPQAVQKLEKDIAKLTADKEKLEVQMADGAFFSDQVRAQKIQADYAALCAQLAEKEERWLEATG